MRRLLFALAGVCSLAGFAGGFEFSRAGYWQVADSPRRTVPMNLGWEFSLDGFKTVKKVNLPHCIDEGEIGYEASGGVNRQQPAWYRRRFSWQSSGKRQFLHFEAIMGKCRIDLNGRRVAEHFGGFLPIHAEVTGLLKNGDNTLEVWCDNSDDKTFLPGRPQGQLDFTYFGGIYRDAYLVETGDAYVTDSDRGGVYVHSRLEKDGSWTVTADVTLGGETDGTSVELLYDGRKVESPFKPKSPALWSPDEPNLHLLTVRVMRGDRLVDAVGVKFGIRDFSLDANGLTLNGRPFGRKLIGVNRHQDYLYLGMAMPNSLHWRDVKKFRDCGMRVFRCAHYPQDPAFMDACDAMGMFVIVTAPGWQFWNASDPVFERRYYDDVEKMVRRDRSRASLLMWEPLPNETDNIPVSAISNACAIVRRETVAPNYCAGNAWSERQTRQFEVEYPWYSSRLPNTVTPGNASFTREWGDFVDNWRDQNSVSRAAREWGEAPMLSQARHYDVEGRKPNLRVELSQPAFHFGGCVWHGCDHSRGYHPDNFFGGILTYGRQKKTAYYMFKAALTKEPFVHLAHELAPGSPEDFAVYSNCSYTATFLGKPFIPGQTKYYFGDLREMYPVDHDHSNRTKDACFVIRMPDGTVKEHRPAGRLAKINVELDSEGMAPVADGCDMVAVVATLSDSAGTPKRYLTETVRFSVSGAAEIVGTNPQQTHWGEAMVLVRMSPSDSPGPITVKAETVRKGEHVNAIGAVTFTPLSRAAGEPVASGASRVDFAVDSTTGGIKAMHIAGDEHRMNWVHDADGKTFAWIGPQYMWGTGTVEVDGKDCSWQTPSETSDGTAIYRPCAGLEVSCSRSTDTDGSLCERYEWKNVSKSALHLRKIDVHTPFNDNYLPTWAIKSLRCHAHVWTGGSSAWVCAMRIGGAGPHLGLAVTEGSITAYELKKRGLKFGSSEVRGVIALSPPDVDLAPGETTSVAWKVFAHRGKREFLEKVREIGGVTAAASDWLVTEKEPAVVVFEAKDAGLLAGASVSCADAEIETRFRNGRLFARCSYARDGELKVVCRYGNGRQTWAELIARRDPAELVLNRAKFIVERQVYRGEPGDPHNDALVPYLNTAKSQYLDWMQPPGKRLGANHNDARERVGMGVFLAMLEQRSPDPKRRAVLDRYATFCRERLQSEDYRTWCSPLHTAYDRYYNYPWVAEFYTEWYKIIRDPKWMRHAFGTQMYGYSHIGRLPLVESPEHETVVKLREAGLVKEADELLAVYRRHKDMIMRDGRSFSEVNFAPEMCGALVCQFAGMWKLTGDRRYLEYALQECLPMLEACMGPQPSWHSHDIGLHHWDGFWFGIRRCWGDTLPHDWNGSGADSLSLVADMTGDESYRRRARSIVRQLLGLFDSDGHAGCAWVLPDRVDGEAARFRDPLANDQDWALVYYLRQFDLPAHAGAPKSARN